MFQPFYWKKKLFNFYTNIVGTIPLKSGGRYRPSHQTHIKYYKRQLLVNVHLRLGSVVHLHTAYLNIFYEPEYFM